MINATVARHPGRSVIEPDREQPIPTGFRATHQSPAYARWRQGLRGLIHLRIKRTRSDAMIIGRVCSVASSIYESRAEEPESELEQSRDAMSRPSSDFLVRIWMIPVAVLVFAPGRH
jgi:hypothetical protein